MTYLKPGRSLIAVNWFMDKLRVKQTLTVVGRKSGQPRSVIVNVHEHDGKQYLVAPRGETEWVRNLRKAGEAELRDKKGRHTVTSTEITDDSKPEIIDSYVERWKKEVTGYWKKLPDPDDHPVFEITDAESS